MSVSDQLHLELEQLRRDIADKDSQIALLQSRVEQLAPVASSLVAVLSEVEAAAGRSFLTAEQRSPGSVLASEELVPIMRQAIGFLVTLHTNLPSRFEEDFRRRAEGAVRGIDTRRAKVDGVRAARLAVAADVAKLRRIVEFQRQERQSLEAIATNLRDRRVQSERQMAADTDGLQEQIDGAEDRVRTLGKTIRSKEARFERRSHIQASSRPPKRFVDSVKEDAHLQATIDELSARMERETSERELAEEELRHVRSEIRRAERMIAKIKANLTAERQRAADRVNGQLRAYIEQQREDFHRAIANQRKKNSELERQRAELIEEERLLGVVLQTLEKQLQAQMQKLPSLAQLQQGVDAVAPARGDAVGKIRRRLDDGEIKGVKKQMLQLKSRRRRPRSLLAASKYIK
jgi:chromosome segregation ATPase